MTMTIRPMSGPMRTKLACAATTTALKPPESFNTTTKTAALIRLKAAAGRLRSADTAEATAAAAAVRLACRQSP